MKGCSTESIPTTANGTDATNSSCRDSRANTEDNSDGISGLVDVWYDPPARLEKKDGDLRMCIDYRGLNAVTKKDKYPFLVYMTYLIGRLVLRFSPLLTCNLAIINQGLILQMCPRRLLERIKVSLNF